MRPLLLDLFCGAGGAAKGYHDAGFDVVGVDISPQPNYPFQFFQADALHYLANTDWPYRVDAVHASPPCQGYSTMSNRFGSEKPKLIADVRDWLECSRLPWIIENVTGARKDMRDPILLHGGHFGLRVHRPRLFESNVTLVAPPWSAKVQNPIAVYGRASPDRRLLWTRKDGTELRAPTPEEGVEAMGMPWATWDEACEGIPPAYTKYLGKQLLERMGR